MKGKKVENLWNKISLIGCNWSSLNAPRAQTPVLHSLLEKQINIALRDEAYRYRIDSANQNNANTTDRNWRQFNYRLKKLEVVCLVVKNSKLNYDLCFSYRNMLKKVVILASFLDS